MSELGVLNLRTVNDVTAAATGRGSHVAMMTQDGQGGWKNITSDALYGRVRGAGGAIEGLGEWRRAIGWCC